MCWGTTLASSKRPKHKLAYTPYIPMTLAKVDGPGVSSVSNPVLVGK